MKLACILFCALLVPALAEAHLLKEYSVSFDCQEQQTEILITYSFLSINSESLVAYLPLDAANLSVMLDNNSAAPSVDITREAIKLVVNLSRGPQILTIRFLSSQYASQNSTFSALIKTPFYAANQYVRLTLPPQAVLKSGLGSAQVASPSLSPQPTSIDFPNGRFRFSWVRSDVQEGSELNVLAQYFLPVTPNLSETKQANSSLLLLFVPFLSMITTLLVIGIIALLLLRRMTRLPGDVEELLREDEAQVVRVLKSKGGACEQGTLCIVTGFSKAKLSQLVTELELRRVIYKKKRGNKNIIVLKNPVQRFLSSNK